MDLLSPLIGETAARIVVWLLALVVVVALIILVAWALRRYGGGRFSLGNRSRAPRLGIVDAMPVDSRRKLVLIRRDNVEHLLLIGGGTDLIVEQTIQRSAPVARTRAGEPLRQAEPSRPTADVIRSSAAAERETRRTARSAASAIPPPPTSPTGVSEPVRIRPTIAASNPAPAPRPVEMPKPILPSALTAQAPAMPKDTGPVVPSLTQAGPAPQRPAVAPAATPPAATAPVRPLFGAAERTQPRFPVPPGRSDTSGVPPPEPPRLSQPAARPAMPATQTTPSRPAVAEARPNPPAPPVVPPAETTLPGRTAAPYFPTNMTTRPRTTPYAPPPAAEGGDEDASAAADEAETWPFERGNAPAPTLATPDPAASAADAPPPAAPAERPSLFGPLAAPEADPNAPDAPAADTAAADPGDDDARAQRVGSLENEMTRLLGEIAGRKP